MDAIYTKDGDAILKEETITNVEKISLTDKENELKAMVSEKDKILERIEELTAEIAEIKKQLSIK